MITAAIAAQALQSVKVVVQTFRDLKTLEDQRRVDDLLVHPERRLRAVCAAEEGCGAEGKDGLGRTRGGEAAQQRARPEGCRAASRGAQHGAAAHSVKT